MLRQILQLQRRRIQFRFDPFHLLQTIRLYRWKSAGSDRFICGVLFFSGFFFFPCLLQRINQKRTIVRGGTDGSRFTEMGLPTPNLSTGEHNPHSPLEWTCLEEMVLAAKVLVELAQVWGG